MFIRVLLKKGSTMSLEEKVKKLELMTSLYNSMSKGCMICIENGQDEIASKLEILLLNLTVAIEEVTNQTLDEWLNISKAFVVNVEPSISEIEGHLKDISKNIKDLKSIGKTVGKIDKAIQGILNQLT